MPFFNQDLENNELLIGSNDKDLDLQLATLPPNFYFSNNIVLSNTAKEQATLINTGEIAVLKAGGNNYLYTHSLQSCFPVFFRFRNGDVALYHATSSSLLIRPIYNFMNYSFSRREKVPTSKELATSPNPEFISVDKRTYFYSHAKKAIYLLNDKDALALSRRQFTEYFGDAQRIERINAAQLNYIYSHVPVDTVLLSECLTNVAEINVFIKPQQTNPIHVEKALGFIQGCYAELVHIPTAQRPQINAYQSEQGFGVAVCYLKNGEPFMWVGQSKRHNGMNEEQDENKAEEIRACELTEGFRLLPTNWLLKQHRFFKEERPKESEQACASCLIL